MPPISEVIRGSGGIEYCYVSTKEKKVSTLRGLAQLADLQGALCVPTYNLKLLLKYVWRLVCRKLRQKLFIVSQRAKIRVLTGCDGRPQDNTSKLSRPRAWIEI